MVFKIVSNDFIGLVGKIGRFFAIGPREYGVHPLNRMFIFMNRKYMNYQALALHRYSLVKYWNFPPFFLFVCVYETNPFQKRKTKFCSLLFLSKRNLTHNGYHMIRVFKHFSFVLPATILASLGLFVYWGDDNKNYA